ncbi:MAG TPA: UDP-glucose 4-epimerase GalE, partial [Alphaproteobacteria bacterium]|nr:UDP-glucose 4-epimerase GalE [Alphaproteobacteria bacterium]
MKILVVGGAGYIGSHVVEDLNTSDNSIVVFDNLNTGSKDNLPAGIELVLGDITSVEDLNNVFSKGFDIVFHFAALKNAGDSMINPDIYYKNNVIGTLNILNAMVKYGVKHIVFSSSAAVYGNPRYLPMDENHPLNPENFYGFTKLECERLLEWYSRLNGINFASLRYFNAAGYIPNKQMEKNPGNLLPIIMEVASARRESLNIYGDTYETEDGTGIRDYIHVKDLSDAHIKAMNYIISRRKNIIVNLSTEKGHSVLEIVKRCETLLDKKISYKIIDRRAGDPAVVVASSKLAKELLDWETKHSDIDNI